MSDHEIKSETEATWNHHRQCVSELVSRV